MDAAQHLRLYNIIIGSMKTQSIHAAAELGVADVLAAGDKDIAEIARAVGADSAALFRLLRALCSLGLICERAGFYSLTAMGQVLRHDVPGSLRPFALLLGGAPWWRAWGSLTHAVRTGEGAFNATHGIGYFDFLSRNPGEQRRFHDFMTSICEMNAGAIVAGYPFADCRKIVDVGGGDGRLLTAILAAAPAATGVLFDLAGTVPDAGQLDPPVRGRIQIVAGDFFREVPAGGDLYVLQQILHDWDDSDALRILGNCRAAMAPGGRLLVIDAVIEPGNQPSFNKFTDLHMMVLSNGGRERTAPEFKALFERAGFPVMRVIPTSTAFAMIEGQMAL
jgi:SAM-dependent methyltransferase